MSRVLARNMFKKNAPKRSSKGVGITSGMVDDVPGYAEGGEVTDDRTERERIARMLLEQNKDEGEMYQRFSEQERPRMYRPPATMGMMPPQPNPQQMQAAQMQQMAQMGMLPRFQEGGFVQRQPLFGWGSRIRGWSEPSTRGWGSRVPGWSDSQPRGDSELRAENRPDPESRRGWGSNFRGWSEAPSLWSGISRLYTGNPPLPEGTDTFGDPMGMGQEMSNLPLPPGGGRDLFGGLGPSGLPSLSGAFGVPQFSTPSPPNEAEQAAMEADRESRRAAGFSKIAEPEKKKAPPPLPPGEKKKDNLQDIKAEREARKAELAAQADAARKENIWLALMQAGLAIAGGRSSNAITNIGQGGQAGLASFVALEQQRRRDEDAAMRRDIAEREYGLQERKFLAQQPYLQAQTEYLRMRPEIAMAQLQARRDAQVRAAQFKAESDLESFKQKNPYSEELYTNGKLDPIKEAMWLKKKQDRILAIDQAQQQGYGNNRMGLNIPGYTDEE